VNDFDDPYGSDVLADFGRRAPKVQPTIVEAVRDLVVEESATGFVGAVVGYAPSSGMRVGSFGSKTDGGVSGCFRSVRVSSSTARRFR
jgi:hypothetical protein